MLRITLALASVACTDDPSAAWQVCMDHGTTAVIGPCDDRRALTDAEVQALDDRAAGLIQ